MLFVFAPPDRSQGFWMKNTLVALDMVFVTAAGVVDTVVRSAAGVRAQAVDRDGSMVDDFRIAATARTCPQPSMKA